MDCKIKIIGLGGIGSILVDNLSRFLNYSAGENSYQLTLIDGDIYEAKNFERQTFSKLGKKSNIKCNDLTDQFDRLNFISFPYYVNEVTIDNVIEEGDIVFICVDNHKTRNLINNRAKKLSNITIFSGGNEYTDGNVQIFRRKDGVNQTPSLTDYHPEIENSEDRSPDEMSCEELAQSEPQLFFTNLMAATLMCCSFYYVLKIAGPISEVYFDIETLNTNSKVRKIIN